MEAKLDKLFAIFDDYSKVSLFPLCVQQVYLLSCQNQVAIHYILKKTIKLVFSTNADASLQLEHRQVAAGIIEKLYKFHCVLMKQFLETAALDLSLSTLFFVEDYYNGQVLDSHPEEAGGTQLDPTLKSSTLQAIRAKKQLQVECIDFKQLLELEKPLLGKDSSQLAQLPTEEERQVKEDEILRKLCHVKCLMESNIDNIF